MAGSNSGNLCIIALLKILMKYTDENHKLTQNQIIEKLEEEYDLSYGRKAIGIKLQDLADADIYVEHDKDGYYYDSRDFERAELRLLIDSVLCSRHISTNRTIGLIKKLCKQESIYFQKTIKGLSSVEKWDNDSENIFYKIDEISRAIDEKKVIYFKTQRRNEKLELVRTGFVMMSPYTMLLSNQHYYVMGYNDYFKSMQFIRIDKTMNIHVDDINQHKYFDVRTIPGYENGIDYNELSVARPYLFADKIDTVTIKCKKNVIDQVVDWYGTKLDIKPIDDDYVQIKFKTSPLAMKIWALQYLNDVEVIEPKYIREEIGKTISANLAKYRDVISSTNEAIVGANANGSYVFATFDDLPMDNNTEIDDLTGDLIVKKGSN